MVIENVEKVRNEKYKQKTKKKNENQRWKSNIKNKNTAHTQGKYLLVLVLVLCE